MSKHFTTTVQPDVEVHVEAIGGDLVIEGRPGTEFRSGGDDPNVHMEGPGNLTVSCNGDCHLRVPTGSKLTIDNVGGDTTIKNIETEIGIRTVGADVVIRDCGPVTLEQVGADLEIKRANGTVRVRSVGGDAKFREISGDLEANSIGSDALLTDVHGNCRIDSIGADLILDTDFSPEYHYWFHVGADTLCKVSENASVRFSVPANAGTSIEVPNARMEVADGKTVIVMGDGAALVEIETKEGDIRLVSQHGDDPFDVLDSLSDSIIPEDLDEVINARISEHISAIHDRLNRETERIQREAERAAERAREQAERMAEIASQRAREQAERMAEKARRQAERNTERMQRSAERGKQKNRSWDFTFSWPPKSEKSDKMKNKPENMPPAEPVSDDERMMILKMVEAKQITIEEAERLLSALEG